MSSKDNTPREKAISKALAASRARDGESVVDALQGIELRAGMGAPLDETYLSAERLYHLGNYAVAVPGFEAFERDPRSQGAPAWQRYLAAHRRCWMLLYQGDLLAATRVLAEAHRRIRAAPELARFHADLEAIEGHLFESGGEYEQARGRFTRAYEDAIQHKHWTLAMSTALDVATLLGHLGRPADAPEWIRKAWGALADSPDRRGGARTIKLRAARMSTQLKEYDEAKELLDEVVRESEDGLSPLVLIDAFVARADVSRAERNFAAAEADLREAARVCDQHGSWTVRVFTLLDTAKLYLERGGAGDRDKAREAFGRALGHTLALGPHHARLIERLADDVLDHPSIVARRMSSSARRELERALNTVKELARPRLFQQAERLRERDRALGQLSKILSRFRASEIRLAHATVFPLAGDVIFENARRDISKTEVQTLEALLKAPHPGLTTVELAAELDITPDATKKRLARLGDVIGADLVRPRPGGPYVYSVRKPATG